VDSEAELESAFRDAVSEAGRAFRSAEVYVEKLIEQPRHIEIQILADRRGNMIHLGVRECSIQRRHQKVIEECPSPLVECHPGMRQAMGEAALCAARAAGYTNAGTVEFLVDRDRTFYFLEMNTRLQVEHPVTELVTGLDLVHWQLRIAAGEELDIRQEDLDWRGHAIECRIYAEDPYNNFFPSPGRVTALRRPHGPGIRLDSGMYTGWTVPIEYDPMLAKLAVWGPSREQAVQRMMRALDEYSVDGIQTTLEFYRQVFADERYRQALLHTGFIDDFLRRKASPALNGDPDLEHVAAMVAAIETITHAPIAKPCPEIPSAWRTRGREGLLQ
jgi:acetyl-CoA carboxylase biotin carboxylase subunit